MAKNWILKLFPDIPMNTLLIKIKNKTWDPNKKPPGGNLFLLIGV